MQRNLHSCFSCYRLVTCPCHQPTRKKKAALSYINIIGLMNTIKKITALVTSTLLIGVLAAPANAATKTEAPQPVQAVERAYQPNQPTVASSSATVNFESPVIKTVAAPIPEPEPVVVSQATRAAVTPAATTAVTPSKAPQTAAKAQPQVSVAQAPVAAVKAPVASVAASGAGAALLGSARSQIGQIQDCTAMVERALSSIGIVTGDLAPAQFFKFGSVVGSPQPGDIIISAGHVGIYSGNGMMVSGGFNGNQTVEHPISYVGGYSAVRVA